MACCAASAGPTVHLNSEPPGDGKFIADERKLV
jgi:hypothetical protein